MPLRGRSPFHCPTYRRWVTRCCVFANQNRSQKVVDQADHEHPSGDERDALPCAATVEKVDRHWHPHQRRADGGQQRQKRHQHAQRIAPVAPKNQKATPPSAP